MLRFEFDVWCEAQSPLKKMCRFARLGTLEISTLNPELVVNSIQPPKHKRNSAVATLCEPKLSVKAGSPTYLGKVDLIGGLMTKALSHPIPF